MNEIIKCNALTKHYNGEVGIQDVNLGIVRGRIVGLLGPNGSGKSTLIKLINGMITPTRGEIFIDGKKPGIETKKIVSYLPERNCLNGWMKVNELVTFYDDFYRDFDKEKAYRLIETLEINKKAKLKTLSKGTREKIQLILVMSRQAELYCLDEPIGGVDPAAREYIIRTIINNYNKQATILISTHLIADIEEILDDVVFIQEGSILKVEVADQLRKENGMSIDEIFRRMYKC
ncbi:MAG: ABC transporter ATP-binding protein [Epulopiscium sp.]|nr:ABC transporter ATP-binding protein [Candidatus Epulonipiscium sp.]